MKGFDSSRSQVVVTCFTAVLIAYAYYFVGGPTHSTKLLPDIVALLSALIVAFTVILKHDEEVQRLREQFDVEMKKVRQDCDRIVQEDHCRNEAEMMSMAVRHQKVVVAVLDEKVAEAEKNSEQLRLDKKNLQFSLTNDSDQRNQVLWKEISSLQTALELKSAEMKELRQKNQQLSLLADEIPLKELEIAKWRHKTNEYRQNLDQKLFGEKMLLQQMEEMRRRQILDEEEKSAMKKNLDLLIFRMENGNSLEFPEETPKVQFRNSYSPRRPISSTGLTDDADRVDVMARSTLSMYTSQVRLPLNHSDDVIYAPDAIISSRSASSAQASKSIPFEDEPIIRESKSQSDSGIGTLT